MRRLLEQHVPPVYRFSLRLTGGDTHAAEDLTQEALLRAWRHRAKLPDTDRTRGWLFKITVNLWRDQLRRAKVRSEGKRQSAAAGGSSAVAPPQHVIRQREELAAALRALDALPPRQREVLHLSACEGLSIAQIAEVLEINAGAVKASLSLARRRLREDLESHLTPSACGDRQ